MNPTASFHQKMNLQMTCLILTVLALIAGIITIYTQGDEVTDYYFMDPAPASINEVTISFSHENCVKVNDISLNDNMVTIIYQALKPGETKVTIQAQDHDIALHSNLKVSSLGLIFDQGNGNIGGRQTLLVIATLWFFLMAITLLRFFRHNIAQKLYSYRLMFSNAFGFYLLVCGIGYLTLLIKTLQDPQMYGGFSGITMLFNIKWDFLVIGMPFMIIFALSLTISNIVLMKKEGFRPQNALGIFLGLAILGGEMVSLMIYGYFQQLPTLFKNSTLICGVITTGFIYFICLLLSAMVCGINAARHEPPLNRDYIIILGCAIREDGTLYPLLRGRVDRAVDFYRKQLSATGHAPILVPSGGQGSDEICSEAAAMKHYLTEFCHIPEMDIMIEDRSTTTLENMAFSKQLIQARSPESNIAFSTTNYHVFRAGILSQKVNCEAEGMGAPTKWYFWPNAFLREVVGLVVENWPLVLSLLATVTILYLIPLWFLPV